jgi:hypothetical protein
MRQKHIAWNAGRSRKASQKNFQIFAETTVGSFGTRDAVSKPHPARAAHIRTVPDGPA